MFKGFNLSLTNPLPFSGVGEYNRNLIENKESVKTLFDSIMLADGKLDAEQLIKQWFPNGDYQVFISHSHKDVQLAESLANWLYERFGIKSFVDSHVWGYANELLKDLNDRYAKTGSLMYDYGPAIANAANVHLMLSTALSEVIDKAECLFFINTENTLENVFLDKGYEESRTSSPWIMHELKVSSIIRRKRNYKGKVATEDSLLEAVNKSKSAVLSYQVPTEHLFEMKEVDLIKWYDLCQFDSDLRYMVNKIDHLKSYDALSRLYDIYEKG